MALFRDVKRAEEIHFCNRDSSIKETTVQDILDSLVYGGEKVVPRYKSDILKFPSGCITYYKFGKLIYLTFSGKALSEIYSDANNTETGVLPIPRDGRDAVGSAYNLTQQKNITIRVTSTGAFAIHTKFAANDNIVGSLCYFVD